MSDTGSQAPRAEQSDYDRLLHANLNRIFNERDAGKRAVAIAELYVEEPVMYEPDNILHGREAISAVAGALLERFGPGFRFTPEGPATGHHGMGVLSWHAGPEGGPITVTGKDVAEIVDGRIARLWVLLGLTAG